MIIMLKLKDHLSEADESFSWGQAVVWESVCLLQGCCMLGISCHYYYRQRFKSSSPLACGEGIPWDGRADFLPETPVSFYINNKNLKEKTWFFCQDLCSSDKVFGCRLSATAHHINHSRSRTPPPHHTLKQGCKGNSSNRVKPSGGST